MSAKTPLQFNKKDKLNVLCLHGCGMGVNLKLPFQGFEDISIWPPIHQIRKFIEKEEKIATFYFARGPYECNQTNGYPDRPGLPYIRNKLYRWYDLDEDRGELGGLKESLRTVESFIKTKMKGKVDVLIGFSQGGMMIEKIFERLPEVRGKVRGVIFINTGGPWYYEPTIFRTPHEEALEHYKNQGIWPTKHSLHIWSSEDGLYKDGKSPAMLTPFPSDLTCVEDGADHSFLHPGITLTDPPLPENWDNVLSKETMKKVGIFFLRVQKEKN